MLPTRRIFSPIFPGTTQNNKEVGWVSRFDRYAY